MKVVNARGPRGSLFSFEILGQGFSEVLAQKDWVSAKGGARDLEGRWVFPAMVDIHVHSRDPGMAHKEDWHTLTAAAYKGGVTCVCDMPNTIPATMDLGAILQKKALAAAAGIDFFFYLGVGPRNLHELAGLLQDPTLPLCGLKIYYGQSTGDLMYDDLARLATVLPKPFPGLLAFHSEDQCAIDHNHHALQPGTLAAAADFAVHSAIRSSEAAHVSTQKILDWGFDHGFAVHIAHLSTPAEVVLIEAARQRGQIVTAEVAPHHLIFATPDYARLGGALKMNPPVRSPEERDALCRDFGRGLIEAFATDHAPHTAAEKAAKEYKSCPSGVPGVEYFAPLLLTLGKRYGLSLEAALAMGCQTPYRLLGKPERGQIAVGAPADFVVLEEGRFILPAAPVASKCQWTPYAGMDIDFKVVETWHRGAKVYAIL